VSVPIAARMRVMMSVAMMGMMTAVVMVRATVMTTIVMTAAVVSATMMAATTAGFGRSGQRHTKRSGDRKTKAYISRHFFFLLVRLHCLRSRAGGACRSSPGERWATY
jgi:hypothetical protein